MAKRAANCHEAICNGEPVEAFEGKKSHLFAENIC